jgi:hypothetical protein
VVVEMLCFATQMMKKLLVFVGSVVSLVTSLTFGMKDCRIIINKIKNHKK